ncbi:MAG: L-lactate dehydrogenase [Planctomycetes bacterium]|nr:L-lactate dehydrogenase [Planctomycetota bacterium]
MQQEQHWKPRKVVVVGAGTVGSTFAYSLAQAGLADDIALIDENRRFAEGQVLDLLHGQPFYPTLNIHVGEAKDFADAQVIVVTAGAKQRPGQSRLELLRANVAIVERIVGEVVAQGSEAVLILVTNPVDILTYVAAKKTGWERGRVIGSGTVLDSARLRHLLSQQCEVDVHNVHAYVLGEHGDSEFVAWSLTHIAGMPIDDYYTICRKCGEWTKERGEIERAVRDSAYHVIDYKGATHFAVGLALVRIVGSILRSERSVLTVSTMLHGEFGLTDVCLSVPCVVSGQGIARVVESELSKDERVSLLRSANVLKRSLAAFDSSANADAAD